jgi:hypothetical protein
MSIDRTEAFSFLKGIAPVAAFVVGVASMAILAVALIAPPPIPRGPAGDAFRGLADPALSRTAAFLAKGTPHPAGTPLNESMMKAIVLDIEAAGYQGSDIKIEAFTHANKDMRGKPMQGERPEIRLLNIVIELKGANPVPGAGRTLVVCHYDSTRNGPGAGDDGFGVLACLGALKALKAGRPLKSDVVFLFTDGEEYGLYGSSAAVQKGGMAQGTSFVINMEGLEAGIALPIEMSAPNGKALDAYLSSVPRPFVMGIIVDLFSLLPFGTDLNEFEEAGVKGLTISPISGFSNYHSPGDVLGTLDAKTLAQASRGIVKMLARIDSGNLGAAKTDWIAQSLLPGLTLRYPSALSWLFTALPWMIFIASAAIAIISGKARLSRMLLAAGIALGILIASLGISYLAQRALGSPGDPQKFFAGNYALRKGIAERAGFNLFMSILVPLIVSALACFFAKKWLRGAAGSAGVLGLPLAAATLLAGFLPRSGPLLLFPAAVCAVIFGLNLFLPRTALTKSVWAFAVAAAYALLASGFLIVANATIVILGMAPAVALFACFAVTVATPFMLDEENEAAIQSAKGLAGPSR